MVPTFGSTNCWAKDFSQVKNACSDSTMELVPWWALCLSQAALALHTLCGGHLCLLRNPAAASRQTGVDNRSGADCSFQMAVRISVSSLQRHPPVWNLSTEVRIPQSGKGRNDIFTDLDSLFCPGCTFFEALPLWR